MGTPQTPPASLAEIRALRGLAVVRRHLADAHPTAELRRRLLAAR